MATLFHGDMHLSIGVQGRMQSMFGMAKCTRKGSAAQTARRLL